MPDNRIRFSAQFDSSGADKVKRDLDEVREGRKALDDVIGSGARVRQEAAQGMDASAEASLREFGRAVRGPKNHAGFG